MLVEFRVGNYRSFSEIQTFSMVASNVKSVDPSLDLSNVVKVEDDLSLLKSAAIYGANGSGKSNLVRAMAFVRKFVATSSKETQISDEIDVDQFRLSAATHHEPSFFEFVFLIKGKQFRYGFEVDSRQVVSEWLFHVPTIREAKLFERRRGTITVSKAFKEGRKLEDKTRENALFLSVCAQFNGPISRDILNWYSRFNLVSGLNDTATRNYTIKCVEEPAKKKAVIEFVQSLDFRIKDLLVEDEEPVTDESLPKNMPEKLKTFMLELGATKGSSLKTVRVMEDGTNHVVFDLGESESAGTQKLISLAGPLIDTLRTGKTIMIDELDARLHPLITREIIKLFNSQTSNPRGAQLIFTTHDTNLLSNKLFRRDQIWFSELDNTGATHLYSLVEYRVRNDASYEKDYVSGRYGAIPFIGELDQLFEASHD